VTCVYSGIDLATHARWQQFGEYEKNCILKPMDFVNARQLKWITFFP